MGLRILDLATYVQAISTRFSAEEIVRTTGLSFEKLEQWRRGESFCLPREESMLLGFGFQHRAFDLLEALATAMPTFDLTGKNQTDEYDLFAPPLGFNHLPPDVELFDRSTTIAGLPVAYPFGISASILTRNSDCIAFYARRGFDILTYKTVRSKKHEMHPHPNWVFLNSHQDIDIRPPFDAPVIAGLDYWPDEPSTASMANSFGTPSQDPSAWQADVERAKHLLHKGQILIVSVTSTPPSGDKQINTLIDDFVSTALMAKDAGADIVEANYSCPNTPNEVAGQLFQDPELSGRVTQALKIALGQTPLLVKIGYLPMQELKKFVNYNSKYADGYVAINSITMPVSSSSGDEVFPKRRRAGISGALIRPWAMEVLRNLVTIRAQMKMEFTIIGVGGVGSSGDVNEYLNLGIDGVQSCTAAFLNPHLAIEVRQLLADRIR